MGKLPMLPMPKSGSPAVVICNVIKQLMTARKDHFVYWTQINININCKVNN